MHETDAELAALQSLIDSSYERAGDHLRTIITPDRVLTAEQVVAELTGMCLLTLATVTSDGRPLAGAVDGMFYRGKFWFGSAPNSLRFTHIRHTPYVSASYLPAETTAITVHGKATIVDIVDDDLAGFCDYAVSIYGDWWREFSASGIYARIDADRMFTFSMEAGA